MAGDLEAGFWTYLQTQTAITDLVSTRVYPLILPQNPVFPALTYNKISDLHNNVHSGSGGFSRALIQFDCWAETDDQARDLAEKLRLALQGYKGSMGSETVQGVLLLDERKGFEPDDVEQFRVILDFAFWYKEDIPV